MFKIWILTSLFLSTAMAQTSNEPTRPTPRVGELKGVDLDRIEARIHSRHFSSFGFGPFGSDRIAGLLYGFSLGHNWETTPTTEFRLTTAFATNGNGQYLDAGVGFGYLPLTTDISPVLGAQLGGGFAHYYDKAESRYRGGYGLGAFGGVRLNRTGDFQMEILLTYGQIFATDTPNAYGLQLRLLY